MQKTTTIITATIVLLLGAGILYYLAQNKEVAMNNGTQGGTSQSTVEQSSKKDVREAIWEQMPEQQKETIDGTWKNGEVSKNTLQGVMMIGVEDKSYEGKEVYVIELPRKRIDTLGDTLMVFADIDTYDLIGFGPLE